MFLEENWFRARKQLLEEVKNQVNSHIGLQDSKLGSYYQNYKKTFSGNWKISNSEDILMNMPEAKIVLGGDFHAFRQSQKVHLRLLRNFNKGSRVCLAMECFEQKHQKHLDNYMRGKLSEQSFLKKINWDKNWHFPWENYKPLVVLAKKKGFKVIGVNLNIEKRTISDLKKRDKFAAKIIKEIYQKYQLTYVIFGDLHLAKEHLPAEVEKATKVKPLVIYQNSEKLYFKGLRQNMSAKTEVFRLNKSKYCVLSAPPWIKWQSYLMFLEKSYDLDYDDQQFDFNDQFKSHLDFICNELKIKDIKKTDFSVFSPFDDDFWKKFKEGLKSHEEKALGYFIKSEQCFYYPKKRILYLSRPTVNFYSDLVGYYLQANMSGRTNSLWSMPENYLALIWLEALAFFVSKIINDKRKPTYFNNLKAQLTDSSLGKLSKESLLLSVDQRLCEILKLQGHSRIKRKINPKKSEVYYDSAKKNGHILGNNIFIAYQYSRISLKDIHGYFKINVFANNFESKYYDVLKIVDEFSQKINLGSNFNE